MEIQDLKNHLNSFKNIDMNKINNLQNEINNKNNQLNQLRQQLQNVSINNNQNIQNILQNDKCVNFITTDSSLFYAIPCNGNSTFAEIEEKLYKEYPEYRETNAEIEEKLYKEYPEYRETNNTFLANGTEILRFKTINENKIGTGKPVMLIKPS